MNRQETGVIMDIIKAAYPRYYSGIDMNEQKQAVNLWATMFEEESVELVAAAVKALIATDTKGFPPHIGAVKEKLRQIKQPQKMTPAEAWGIVWKAIQRSAYSSKEEFENLPKTIQRIVGSAAQLRAWSIMDADTVQSVIGSNFQRSYKERVKQEEEVEKLPNDIRMLIQQTADMLALEDKRA